MCIFLGNILMESHLNHSSDSLILKFICPIVITLSFCLSVRLSVYPCLSICPPHLPDNIPLTNWVMTMNLMCRKVYRIRMYNLSKLGKPVTHPYSQNSTENPYPHTDTTTTHHILQNIPWHISQLTIRPLTRPSSYPIQPESSTVHTTTKHLIYLHP